ncbi:MAG: TerB family tellurite resistance protein [Cytophagaceae bacterium]|jgi:tellurite resistance protein|nr:TerB family tellurite resistance protein [Cytophagaceae bacterium]
MAKENIHRAMGSLAYAIAIADGTIQPDEKKTIINLALKEFKMSDTDNEWINNMFNHLEKQKIGLEDAYNYALDTLEANRYDFDFDAGMKEKCIVFMRKVADAFGDVDRQEQSLIERFQEDMAKF